MCKSEAEGGARCAAHTRPRYDALMSLVRGAKAGPFGFDAAARKKARDSFKAVDQEDTGIGQTGEYNALQTVSEHAATPSGAKQIDGDIAAFAAENDRQMVAFLTSAKRSGETKRAATKEANAIIRKHQSQLKAITEGHRGGGAGTSVEALKPSVGTTPENNCVAIYPNIVDYWRPEDNNGIGPDQCRPGSNGQLNWRCAKCKQLVSRHNFRVNALTSGLKVGRLPYCDACAPERQARFRNTQTKLSALSESMVDTEAFKRLPPALRYQILDKLGLTSGTGMDRDLSVSMVSGDLTLTEVATAVEITDLDGRIHDTGDEDTELQAGDSFDIHDDFETDSTRQTRVSQVMSAVGVLGLTEVNEDETLKQAIMAANVNALWNEIDANPNDVDAVLADVQTNATKSEFAQTLATQFHDEVTRAQNLVLPDGYQVNRVNPDGTVTVMEPTLSQRRFVNKVLDEQTYCNWGGTGFGKTLSATLSVQAAQANETLVVCPLPVMDHWRAEFENGFGTNVDVRMGLPTGTEPAPTPGVNRVWVVNYDQFRENERMTTRVRGLASRVDAIVFDEIHMAKQTDETARSQRRGVLEQFRDTAGRNNPNLTVIGLSATPVVNNLVEAKSVLRIVEGPDSKPFATQPTLKNAATAHQRITQAGMRQLPTYPTTLTRTDETVDVSTNLGDVISRVNRLRTRPDGSMARMHPAIMERALLPEKLPAITAKVKAATGPTVVYTEYTKGMVEPIQKTLEAEGFRVGTYTGDEPDAVRTRNLEKFKRGELDVLIGSKPIATGVDGLQHVTSNLVVASMAWTSAQDDQLVGRFQRRGQTRNVTASYILTEANVNGVEWSWCKNNRQKRLLFKRTLAAAAVDGQMPEGILNDNQNHAATQAFDALVSLVNTHQAAA